MTTELVNIEEDKYIIVFHDGSTQEITESQQDLLLKASVTDKRFIKVNGNTINFSAISKILTLGEYYKEYPNKIPEQRSFYKTETYEELSVRELWERDITRAKGIKEGLLKSIKENDTRKKRDILNRIKKTIKELEV